MTSKKEKVSYKAIETEGYKHPYVIVDAKTNNILDDGNGYGFRSKSGALACYRFKLNKNKEENKS